MIEVSCDPLTVAGFLYLLTIWLTPRAERITFQSNNNTNSANVGCSRHVIPHVIPLVYTGHFNHNTNKDNQRYIPTSVYATFPQRSTVGPEVLFPK